MLNFLNISGKDNDPKLCNNIKIAPKVYNFIVSWTTEPFW